MSSRKAPAPRRPTSFLNLPPELRNEIYMMVVPNGLKKTMNMKALPKKSLHIVQVEGQIGTEASAIYFGSNTFHATSFSAACKFLKYAGPKRRGMIRRLKLAISRRTGRGREAKMDDVMSAVNALGGQGMEGLNGEAIFVDVEGVCGLVCMTEVEELEIVDAGDGWNVRPRTEPEPEPE